MTFGSLKLRNRTVVLGLALGGAAVVALTAAGMSVAQGGAAGAAASEPASSGGAASLRRMNEDQYKRSIAQIFGADIKIAGRFEPGVRDGGLLAIGDSHVVVTPGGLEQYAIRAREISAQVLDDKHRKTFLPCEPATPTAFDTACAQQFFGKYGRLLFRRPLSEKELASVMGMAQAATTQSGSFVKGVGAGLSQLLVSSPFIFRMETVEADPDKPGSRRLDSYALASRISFLLWNSPPDEELLNAAAGGTLHSAAGLQQQVDRMLASPKVEEGVRAFFADMFAYNLFDGLAKDPALYPIFNPQLRNDAMEQSLRTIVDHLVTRKADYRDIFTTKQTFLSRSLGALYGVKVDYRAFDGWMPYTIPATDPRAGVLTLPAFLMLDQTHEGRSSPTIRGKTIRELFLCDEVPMPPANVNFDLVQDVNDKARPTARIRLSAHSQGSCAGCHSIMDPIGLAMENYDAVGNYRTMENGVKIDASGTFDDKPYKNAVDLMKLLRASDQPAACVVKRVFEYGVGRHAAEGEEAWLTYTTKRFGTDDKYVFPSLLRRVAISPAFQRVAPDAAPAKVALK